MKLLLMNHNFARFTFCGFDSAYLYKAV